MRIGSDTGVRVRVKAGLEKGLMWSLNLLLELGQGEFLVTPVSRVDLG